MNRLAVPLLFSQTATADPSGTVELIKAIASLWLLAFMIVAPVVIYWFREDIRNLVRRLKQYKHGEHELNLEPSPSPTLQGPSTSEQKGQDLPPPSEEPVSAAVTAARVEGESDPGMEMLLAFETRDLKKAEEFYEQLKSAERDPEQRTRDEVWYLYLRFKYAQDSESLNRLHELARDRPESTAYRVIGLCYDSVDDHRRAAEAYEAAAEHAPDKELRASDLVAASKARFRSGDTETAFPLLMEELAKDDSTDSMVALYEGLAQLYEMNGDHELRALALEKALEHKPNDSKILFGASYSFSQARQEALALLHYRILLKFSPDDATSLNNLGVQYEQLAMPILSVSSYKKAAGLGETLAMANLAFSYLNAGFLEEASKVLDNAKSKEHIHPNVGKALAALSSKQEDERETERKHLDAARKQQRFNLEFSRAYFVASSGGSKFAGDWKDDKGKELTVVISDRRMTATWKATDEFASQLVSRLLADAPEKVEGVIQNRGVEADFFKLESSFDFTKNQSTKQWVKKNRGLGFVSEDGAELHFLQFRSDGELAYLSFKRMSKSS